MSQRAPQRAGTFLLSVTRPMTAPSLMGKLQALWASSKLQTPRPRETESSKHQTPSTREATSYKPQAQNAFELGVWSLEFEAYFPGASLKLGVWDLEFSLCSLAPSLLVIHETNDHPTHRTFGVANRLARSQTVGRDHHGFMQGGAVGIDGDLREALGLAAGVDGLANEQSPPRQAGVLASGSQVAFNAGEQHLGYLVARWKMGYGIWELPSSISHLPSSISHLPSSIS